MWESTKCDNIWCELEMPLVWSQDHLVNSHQIEVLYNVDKGECANRAADELVPVSHSTVLRALGVQAQTLKVNHLLHRLCTVLMVAASAAISALLHAGHWVELSVKGSLI